MASKANERFKEMASDLPALLARLVIALDLLYDSTKDQIGIWSVLSDIIVEMQRSSRQTKRVKLWRTVL